MVSQMHVTASSSKYIHYRIIIIVKQWILWKTHSAQGMWKMAWQPLKNQPLDNKAA